MTTFNGRRTLNVSQFLANGNTVSPPTDVASDNGFTDFDNDLARFTNVDFTQVDLNDEGLFNLDGEGRGQREYEGQKGESSRSQNGEVLETEGRGLDFVNGMASLTTRPQYSVFMHAAPPKHLCPPFDQCAKAPKHPLIPDEQLDTPSKAPTRSTCPPHLLHSLSNQGNQSIHPSLFQATRLPTSNPSRPTPTPAPNANHHLSPQPTPSPPPLLQQKTIP